MLPPKLKFLDDFNAHPTASTALLRVTYRLPILNLTFPFRSIQQRHLRVVVGIHFRADPFNTHPQVRSQTRGRFSSRSVIDFLTQLLPTLT